MKTYKGVNFYKNWRIFRIMNEIISKLPEGNYKNKELVHIDVRLTPDNYFKILKMVHKYEKHKETQRKKYQESKGNGKTYYKADETIDIKLIGVGFMDKNTSMVDIVPCI